MTTIDKPSDSSEPAQPAQGPTEGPPAAAPIPRAVLFWAALLMVLAGVMGLVAAQRFRNRTPSGAAGEAEPKKELPAEWITSCTSTRRTS